MDLYVNDTIYPIDKNVSIYIRSCVDDKLSGNPRLLLQCSCTDVYPPL